MKKAGNAYVSTIFGVLLSSLFSDAHAAGVIVGVPSWLLGVAFLIAVGFVAIKFLFNATEAVIDKVQDAGAAQEDRDRFNKLLQAAREDLTRSLSEILKTDDPNRLIESNDPVIDVKNAAFKVYGIKIYDNKYILGKTTNQLVNDLEGQQRKYLSRGGLYN